MTLPNKVVTGAAGTSDASNTKYTLRGNDGGGFPIYNADSGYGYSSIRWDTGRAAWIFDSTDSASSAVNPNTPNAYYYSTGGQTLASGPVGTYTVTGQGAAPAPTVTDAANPQIAHGTTGLVTATGPGTTAAFNSWTLYDSAGSVIASGYSNSNGMSAGAVNGYNVSDADPYVSPLGQAIRASVTLPAVATVQPGDSVVFSMGDGSKYTGFFDVVTASGPPATGPSGRILKPHGQMW